MKKYENAKDEIKEEEVEATTKKGRSKGKRNSNNKKSSSKSKGGNQSSTAALQKNINIIKNAASFNYFKALGRKLGLSDVNPFSEYVEYKDMRFPGIMTLEYVHGPGLAVSNDDPINISADAVYTFNRHMNSGAANYDSNDQMVYMLAAGELFIYWAYAVRAFGLINLYDSTNVYLPKALVEAAGFDYDDLIANQTKMRGLINTYAALMCSYAVPDVLPYYKRLIDVASRVFVDRDVLKPQIYLFRPLVSRIYSEATSDKGAELIPELIPDKLTVEQWSTRMSAMITAFRRSEDIGIISGDLLKAYGRENCVTMPVIEENYVVFPEYDRDWLSQIHNSRILTYRGDISDAEIESFKVQSDVDSGLVKYLPLHRSMICGQFPFLIDVRESDPEPWDNIVATRLMPNVTYGIGMLENKRVWAIQSAGIEIVLAARIWTLTDNSVQSQHFVTSLDEANTVEFIEGAIARASKFNWAPFMFDVKSENLSSAHPKYEINDVVGEIANYTVISGANLNELHRAEMLEAFRIPYEGSY